MRLLFIAFIFLGGCAPSSDVIYLKGLDAYNKQQYLEAAPLIRQAAEKKQSDAMAVLGSMYLFGRGVPFDGAQAEKWLLRGYEAGNKDAGSILGMMYATGKGVPKDHQKAISYLTQAADRGDEKALKMLDIVLQNGRSKR